MELTLIRHTTPAIEKGICYGNSDIGVADSFLKEANQIKQALQKIKTDIAFCSSLSRCVKLAQVCGFKNVVQESRLEEMHFGEWELKPWDKITGEYADKWMGNYYKYPAPGGESYQNLLDRVADFYKEICTKYPESHLTIFTHAGPIRAFYNIIKQVPSDEIFNIDVPFGSFHTFQVDLRMKTA